MFIILYIMLINISFAYHSVWLIVWLDQSNKTVWIFLYNKCILFLHMHSLTPHNYKDCVATSYFNFFKSIFSLVCVCFFGSFAIHLLSQRLWLPTTHILFVVPNAFGFKKITKSQLKLLWFISNESLLSIIASIWRALIY